jgi:plastocyanin
MNPARHRRARPALLATLALIAVAAGLGRVATAQPAGVTVMNFMFLPPSITVQPGATVTWTQRDSVAHTVTSGAPNAANAGSVFDHALPNVGDTYSFTFSTAGSYAYFCRYHPWMLGTVQVGAAAAPAATATPAPAPLPAVSGPVTGGPSNAVPVATGLRNPRGFTWGPDGSLYVAEAGTQPVVPGAPPPSPRTPLYNTDGRVSRIAPDGTITTVADNLPVVIQFNGEPIGPTAVAWTGDVLWVLISKNGDSGHPNFTTGVYGVNADGTVTLLTDLNAYNLGHPQQQIPPDNATSNPYDMIALNNKLYITDGNAGVVFEVDPALPPNSNTRHLADLSPLGPGGGHPVLTGIAAGPDGNLYLTDLTKAPFPQGGGFVWQVTLGGDVNQVATGVTLGTGIAVSPDGTYYVSEFASNSTFAPPGRVVQVGTNGMVTPVASPILFPTMLRWGPDNALYVSYLSAHEPGTTPDGGIFRISVP